MPRLWFPFSSGKEEPQEVRQVSQTARERGCVYHGEFILVLTVCLSVVVRLLLEIGIVGKGIYVLLNHLVAELVLLLKGERDREREL